jgi:hypothetical protein
MLFSREIKEGQQSVHTKIFFIKALESSFLPEIYDFVESIWGNITG